MCTMRNAAADDGAAIHVHTLPYKWWVGCIAVSVLLMQNRE